ncbi:imidazole glycerol phosphate synthase subunit HisF [Ferroplasma sp.]|uniref:imidazole glycerol phosphate synthase subunit HisF n=1 Tax=Ferroplasma sp. TaxID=2591003 RepID=UPI00262204E7|nr:imidazole glycerol phosphate synthase subunit HisF [Ferroplasma sp.]MCL4452632.1 imidazole glycerol phosphate synthase subunit HisF [Candidatus Thermoplasmatota archaeon]
MLAKRIIAALDIAGGRVVKGVNFQNIQDSGDPVDLAKRYVSEGMDEIVFLDIMATADRRKILSDLVKRVASEISIPFTVGGGLSDLDDMVSIIRNGADKIFINTYAVKHPEVIGKISDRIGSANTVIAIDAMYSNGKYRVCINGGSIDTGMDAIEWGKTVASLGAGELLVTSINTDGTMSGFDINLIRDMVENVDIPVIASGGAGGPGDFLGAFNAGADGALAASIFHRGIYSAVDIKKYLREHGINVRL